MNHKMFRQIFNVSMHISYNYKALIAHSTFTTSD